MSNYSASSSPIKHCPKCQQDKPATPEFYNRNKTKSDGLSYWCKACDAVYREATKERELARRHTDKDRQRKAKYGRAYRVANKEKIAAQRHEHSIAARDSISEYGRKWRTANAEHIKQRDRIYVAANRERILEKKRAYARANASKMAEKSRLWYAENKERAAKTRRVYAAANRTKKSLDARRYHARKLKAEGSHTIQDVLRQYKAQKGKCYYCGKKVGDKYHVDHVIPLIRGGSDGPENIVIACPSCNTSKHTKLPHEWPQGGRLL